MQAPVDEAVHNSPVWPGKDVETRQLVRPVRSTLSQGKEKKLKAAKAVTTAALQASHFTWNAEDITTHTSLTKGFLHCPGSETNDTTAH